MSNKQGVPSSNISNMQKSTNNLAKGNAQAQKPSLTSTSLPTETTETIQNNEPIISHPPKSAPEQSMWDRGPPGASTTKQPSSVSMIRAALLARQRGEKPQVSENPTTTNYKKLKLASDAAKQRAAMDAANARAQASAPGIHTSNPFSVLAAEPDVPIRERDDGQPESWRSAQEQAAASNDDEDMDA